MVAKVAPGTGVMVLATSEIEVFKNTIKNNQSYNVTIISYLTTGNPIKDAEYDPYTEKIYVHDNVMKAAESRLRVELKPSPRSPAHRYGALFTTAC